ncbi:hypothetical protein LP421_13055 [Rhizobium sp. RCAM05350]|nr:hypothetical protein LP421_13055 [Rhizobium sp. RCAM05350]
MPGVISTRHLRIQRAERKLFGKADARLTPIASIGLSRQNRFVAAVLKGVERGLVHPTGFRLPVY